MRVFHDFGRIFCYSDPDLGGENDTDPTGSGSTSLPETIEIKTMCSGVATDRNVEKIFLHSEGSENPTFLGNIYKIYLYMQGFFYLNKTRFNFWVSILIAIHQTVLIMTFVFYIIVEFQNLYDKNLNIFTCHMFGLRGRFHP